MKGFIALCSVVPIVIALAGCGSSSSEETAGASVKELPASAPVTSEAQKAAQTAVANDPKAEAPRPDGG